MRDLVITAAAEEDLSGIIDYLAGPLANPEAALSLLDALDGVYQQVASAPFSFSLCTDSLLAGRGYRKALVKRYLFVFRVDAKADRVYILRFFHDLQDYATLL